MIRVREPYFKFKHGKIYECQVEHEKGIEDITIMPLAFENGHNRLFIMSDAKKLFTKDPEFVKEIITMDFEYIMHDGLERDEPSDFPALTNVFATQKDGTLIGNWGEILFGFKETELI